MHLYAQRYLSKKRFGMGECMKQDFAKLHSDVCFKKANGKVIWQPRIDCWIADKMFEHGELPGIYKGMSKVDIYKELGCSARIYEYNNCFYPVYDETLKHKYEWKGNVFYESMETPIGTVTHELEKVDSSWAQRTKKWWVCDEEDLLRECHFRLIDVINESPIDIINFGDNVHSGTLSPQLFEKYVLPEYKMRCERLHRAGKFISAHFDGDNAGLMQYYQETGLDAIEAITPKPQGDVELGEVKKYLGDMFLMDGIPAVYFDKEFSEETLVACVHQILDLFAPNLILGISDEISSTGDIERIRLVGKIVDEYNANIE